MTPRLIHGSQATAETVDLGPPHPPKEDSVVAFTQVLPHLKHDLAHIRRDHQSRLSRFAASRYPPANSGTQSTSLSTLTPLYVWALHTKDAPWPC